MRGLLSLVGVTENALDDRGKVNKNKLEDRIARAVIPKNEPRF